MNGLKPMMCGGKNRSGGRCKLRAGMGTDHPGIGRCKFHGGSSPNGKKYAARLFAETLREAMTGDGEDLTSRDILLRMVRVQHAMVRWVRGQVAELENDDTYGPVGGGEHAEPRFEPHVLIRMRGEEEDRLVKLIKTCHDMQIDERQVRVMEQAGEDMARVIRGILSDFGLAEDPRAPEIVRRHLLRLTAGDVVEGTAA